MSLFEKILSLPFSFRQMNLAKSRDRLGEQEFVSRIVDSGGDQEAAYLIHQKLQTWIYSDRFTPYPDDNLEEIYGIAEEELDEDFILDIISKLGLSPPNCERISAFGAVKTSSDLARWVRFIQSVE